MHVLVYDCETNCLDTENGFVMELAWAVFDSNSWRCVEAQSHLINWPTAFDVDPKAFAATGLSRQFCYEFGNSPMHVLPQFIESVDMADCLCGHNAVSFDHPMMLSNIKRGMLFDMPKEGSFYTLPHIDTLLDIEFQPHMRIHALKYLAFDHGYIMTNAHQALADVFACQHILSKYDFARVLEIAKTPLVTVSKKIEWEDVIGREKAKQDKFLWKPDKKIWEKKVREFFVQGIQLSLGNVDLEQTDQSSFPDHQ